MQVKCTFKMETKLYTPDIGIYYATHVPTNRLFALKRFKIQVLYLKQMNRKKRGRRQFFVNSYCFNEKGMLELKYE